MSPEITICDTPISVLTPKSTPRLPHPPDLPNHGVVWSGMTPLPTGACPNCCITSARRASYPRGCALSGPIRTPLETKPTSKYETTLETPLDRRRSRSSRDDEHLLYPDRGSDRWWNRRRRDRCCRSRRPLLSRSSRIPRSPAGLLPSSRRILLLIASQQSSQLDCLRAGEGPLRPLFISPDQWVTRFSHCPLLRSRRADPGPHSRQGRY